jgi:hypothetical protein
MTDDPSKRRPEDSSRISLAQSWEVGYWTKELNVSEAKLGTAVKAAGHMVTDVKKWLAAN